MKIIQILFIYYTLINTVNNQSTYKEINSVNSSKEYINLHTPSSNPPPPCCDYPPPPAPQVIQQQSPIHNVPIHTVPIHNAPIHNAPTPTPINSIYLTPTCQLMF
jgi:hypothetical protein